MKLMENLAGTKTMFDLLNFSITLLKHNAVYLKEEAIAGIIKYVQNLLFLAGNHFLLAQTGNLS